MLTQLYTKRPNSTEQWRGRYHDMALLCQTCDYSRSVPGVSQGLGVYGGGVGEGAWRILADMLNAQTLLQRPWPLSQASEHNGLRSSEEYSAWAEEHLTHLAGQLA